MANAVATLATLFKNGTGTFMAQVVGAGDVAITQATIASIVYTVSTLDPDDPDAETVVSGHDGVALTVADVVYDTLQTSDSRWTVDTTGYNFLYEIDVSSDEAFPVRGNKYLVKFELTPTEDGQVIDVPFIVTCD